MVQEVGLHHAEDQRQAPDPNAELRSAEEIAHGPGQSETGHRRGEEQPEPDVLQERDIGVQVGLVQRCQ